MEELQCLGHEVSPSLDSIANSVLTMTRDDHINLSFRSAVALDK